jgi:hypothetical protein
MLRSLWSRAVEFVYNSITSLFRTQAEIDTEVNNFLAQSGTVTDNPAEIPASAKRRKNGVFVSPDDAAAWLTRSAIPSEYVTILAIPEWEDDNTYYHIYVIDGGDL